MIEMERALLFMIPLAFLAEVLLLYFIISPLMPKSSDFDSIIFHNATSNLGEYSSKRDEAMAVRFGSDHWAAGIRYREVGP